jgi:hypothetical protein
MNSGSAPVDAPADLTSTPETTDQVDRVAERLRARNIDAVVVDTAADARAAVLERIPDGAEVHWGKSRTLEELGVVEELTGGRYDAIRPRMLAMDRKTQGREIRKMVSAPDVELGSVAAVTADGALVAASATGSQLAAYAAGGGKLILVVGSQKIVANLDEALRRIDETVFPYENDRVKEQLGVETRLEKVLILYGEWSPGRTTVILVREPVGI